MIFHIIMELGDRILDTEMEFSSFQECEFWLKRIGAVKWEIGVKDKDLDSVQATLPPGRKMFRLDNE